MSVQNNRLIIGGEGFDSHRTGKQKEGIAVETGRTALLKKKLGLAQDVTIDGQTFTVNKASVRKWLARTTKELAGCSRSTDMGVFGKQHSVHKVIDKAIKQVGTDLGTVITTHAYAQKLADAPTCGFSTVGFAAELFENEARLTRAARNNAVSQQAQAEVTQRLATQAQAIFATQRADRALQHAQEVNATLGKPSFAAAAATKKAQPALTPEQALRKETNKLIAQKVQPRGTTFTQHPQGDSFAGAVRKIEAQRQHIDKTARSYHTTVERLAATTIQRAYRDYKARQAAAAEDLQTTLQAVQILGELKPHIAAVQIQRMVRGHLARKQVQDMRKAAPQETVQQAAAPQPTPARTWGQTALKVVTLGLWKS